MLRAMELIAEHAKTRASRRKEHNVAGCGNATRRVERLLEIVVGTENIGISAHSAQRCQQFRRRCSLEQDHRSGSPRNLTRKSVERQILIGAASDQHNRRIARAERGYRRFGRGRPQYH